MAWIKMRTDLRDDPDVIAMATALKIEQDLVVGKLHRVWSWADAQTADGNVPGVTPKWLNAYLCAPGFAEAMVEVGWLKLKIGGIVFPNFEVHMSESAKQRALTTKRVAKTRAKKRNEAIVTKVLPEKSREEEKKKTPKEESSKSPLGTLSDSTESDRKTKKPKRKLVRYCSAFEAWWTTYPVGRRIDKKKTHDEWKRAGKRLRDEHDWTSEEAATHLQGRVEVYAGSPAAQRVEFVLHSHRWLNHSRYDDDDTAWLNGGQQITDGPAEATGDYAS